MTAAEGRALMEWDWCYGQTSTVLHHVKLLRDEHAEEWADTSQLVSATATCGRRLYWLSVPGLLSRMGAKRCARCCDRLGYPRGVGSPKNDDDCRPLVEARLKGGGRVS